MNDIEKNLQYVCYERTYQYFLKNYLNVINGDILYVDRLLGFVANIEEPEPIFPAENILLDFLNKECKKVDLVSKHDIISELKKKLDSRVAKLAMEMLNAQNEKYFTSVLVEKIDTEFIYYTKINEVSIHIKEPLTYPEFLSRILIEDNNVEIEWLKYDVEIDVEQLLLEGKKKYIYCDYTFGFKDYIDSQVAFYKETDNQLKLKTEKHLQLRFSKHVLNKLYPIVFFLEEYDKFEKHIELREKRIILESLLGKFYKISSIILSLGKFEYFVNYIDTLHEIDESLSKLYILFKEEQQ